MRAMNEIHTQDLSDVLTAARAMFCEDKKAAEVELFRASFGSLFCVDGACFNEKLTAFEANKALIPTVLADIAVELDARAA